MRWLVLFVLALAWAQGPTYEEWTKYLLSAPDYRLEQVLKGKWPYVEVLRKDRFRDYQKGQCDPQKDPNGCRGRLPWAEAQAHEFYLPMSGLEATREVARDLRKAWQRFEERYYWRVITELNNPAFWFAYCLAGVKGPPLDPPLPDFRLQIPSEGVDPAFLAAARGGLDMGAWASAGLHKLDRYLPVPQVDPQEFCDGLGMQILPLMYIPGFKILIQGHEVFRTEGYPSRPLWFNWDEASSRVERAMQKALTEYYADYQQEVARILLTPRPSTPQDLIQTLGQDFRNLGAPKAYLPVPWQGHLLGGGSVVAPVYAELFPADPTALWNQVQGLWNTYKGLIDQAGSDLEKAYLYVHFYRSAKDLFHSRAFLGLPGMDQVKAALRNLVESPLRTLAQGIPILSRCAGSLDALADCSAVALMKVDGLWKLKRDLEARLAQNPRDAEAQARLHEAKAQLQTDLGPRAQELPIKADREGPGLWKFEEAKRWFGPSSLPVYETFGYTTFFQAANFLEATTVPDIRNVDLSQVNLGNWLGWAWSQLSRLVVYWHVPLTVDIRLEYCPPCLLAYPSPPLEGPIQPLGVPPYILPFALERAHWRWVSVPEGYEVPGVRGAPYTLLSGLSGYADLRALYRPLIGR
ncbi:hypothetical protein [Thermus islandicus]|uniref:hypothetical protein n=1 Tax=Thermus islandicus TaxID=540988 RepID=UPI0003B5666A|nr:hypothetical protein [Thermus islandicus]